MTIRLKVKSNPLCSSYWAACLSAFLFSIVAAGADQPNILIIMADDHAPYVYGAYGNKQVRTPNLDRLAAEGMRFDRAYCNSPVCTASRQAILTGRYPRTTGVTQLQTALPESEVTMAEWFAAAGYDTGAIGKMHFNSNLRHGFRVRFDRNDHAKLLAARGAQPLPEGIPVLGPWKPFRSPAREWLNASYIPYPAVEADMPAHYLADKAEEYLREPRDEPYFLIVSFYQPHSPFRFPVEYYKRLDPARFEAPTVGPQDDWQVPKIFRDLTDEEKQGIAASYYTAVEYLDSNVGRVLRALEESGEAENTIVVYLGDHGYFLGQHGRIEKHALFEEAVRAPLVWRFPERIPAHADNDAMVEFIDIFPTLTDLTGLDTPEGVQGKSFRPVIEGKAAMHRDAVIVEYSENEEAMIRDGRWKLIYVTGNRHRQDGYEALDSTPGRTVLLFDTQADPLEQNNLAASPEHADRIARMTRQLTQHMIDTARQPELLPATTNDYDMLDFCLQPRDVQ